jgi:DNA-binding transcriptional ArsR family regulator
VCLYKLVLDGAVLNALADPRRRAILRLVREVERPSGEIAAEFPDVTGPAISQHLRVLREAGLLAERRAGTRRLYRARPEGLRELRAWIREFWGDALEDLKEAFESDPFHQPGSGR